MPGELQPPHDQQLDQVAQVQAGRGGVEAAIVRDRSAGEELLKFGFVGGDVDQATPLQLLPNVGEGGVVLLRFEAVDVWHAF